MKTFSAALFIGLGLIAFPAASYADSITYVQTSDHCTGNCGIDTNNTITISTTNVANQLLVTETLDTGWFFIATGAGGNNALGFSLPGANGTYTFANFTGAANGSIDTGTGATQDVQ